MMRSARTFYSLLGVSQLASLAIGSVVAYMLSTPFWEFLMLIALVCSSLLFA